MGREQTARRGLIYVSYKTMSLATFCISKCHQKFGLLNATVRLSVDILESGSKCRMSLTLLKNSAITSVF